MTTGKRKCELAHGYSSAALDWLIERDAASIVLATWTVLLLSYIMVTAGLFRNRFPMTQLSKRLDRPSALKKEYERCGYIPDGIKRAERGPLFGLGSRAYLNASRNARVAPEGFEKRKGRIAPAPPGG